MLVLLRVAIGWHFLYSGLDKLNNPDFTSAGFLSQAKGPLAEYFHNKIPDFTGQERLRETDYREKFEAASLRFANHYGLSNEQKTQLAEIVDRQGKAANDFILKNQEAIATNGEQWQRLAKAKEKPTEQNEPFGEKQIWDRQSELRAQVVQWTAALKPIEHEFELASNRLLTPEQQQRGPVPMTLAERWTMDRFITYVLIAIGVCLIGGLFTRLAAVGGGLFLLQVVLAQPDLPGIYPLPHPSVGRSLLINKEFIEMLALFTLATTRVGRWGGLDFIIHHWLLRPLLGKKNNEA